MRYKHTNEVISVAWSRFFLKHASRRWPQAHASAHFAHLFIITPRGVTSKRRVKLWIARKQLHILHCNFSGGKNESADWMQVSRRFWKLHDENLLENSSRIQTGRRYLDEEVLQSTSSDIHYIARS